MQRFHVSPRALHLMQCRDVSWSTVHSKDQNLRPIGRNWKASAWKIWAIALLFHADLEMESDLVEMVMVLIHDVFAGYLWVVFPQRNVSHEGGCEISFPETTLGRLNSGCRGHWWSRGMKPVGRLPSR